MTILDVEISFWLSSAALGEAYLNFDKNNDEDDVTGCSVFECVWP